MDSLLANYASSDEEEEQQHHRQHNRNLGSPSKPTSKFSEPSSSKPPPSIFSSLPQPKSSSLFISLPPPKSHLPNTQTPQNLSLSHTHKADDDDEDSNSAFISIGEPSAKFSDTAKITRLFPSLPEPKFHLSNAQTQQNRSSSHTHNVDDDDDDDEDTNSAPKFSGTAKITRLFPSLPEPKLHLSNPQTITNPSSSDPNPKRVVQFKPPINPSLIKSYHDTDDDEDDEDDKEKERKRRKELESFTQTSSVTSFLSSIPAPKNSGAILGALPSSGSGRRSIIEADVPVSRAGHEVGIDPNVANYETNWVDGSSSASLGTVDGQLGEVMSGSDPSNWVQGGENYGNYGSYGDYGNYGHKYESNWVDRSTTTTMPEMSGMAESVMRIPGKRGRNEVPMEIIEVTQDELIKDRPREDQVKLTGIAFGPAYQPVSTKGKPSKLHKRKHQISSLYFDMKQKETELSERRSRGFLTKAETQAKYGW